ncbi:hypothetical protein ACLFMI_11190 [Pseudonocardia nantongensis]
MTTESNESDRPAIVVLGLLADPGDPHHVAEQLADELPALLAERVSDRVC